MENWIVTMIGRKLEEERLLVGKNWCTNKTEEDFDELDNDDDWAKIGGREAIGRQELVYE
jgi:hypothetical protein